jgi:hypothetical protein
METIPVVYDNTGLVVERVLNWKEAEQLSGILGRIHRAEPFWLGDFLNHIEKVFPQTWTQLIPDDINKESLRNYKWVSERFPRMKRVEGVSWSMHQICAGLEDEAERIKMVERAKAEQLTCKQVRELTRLAKGVKPKDSKTRHIVCPACAFAWDEIV